MEKIVHNGIPITIDISEKAKSLTSIHIIGPRKEWRFAILDGGRWRKMRASGYIENTKPNQTSIAGETTALAEVGMEQLAAFAQKKKKKIRYEFKTTSPAMLRWYLAKGKQALGTKEIENYPTYILAKRIFSRRLRGNWKHIFPF